MSKALVENPAGKPILLDKKRCQWVRDRVIALKTIVDRAYIEFTKLLYEAASGQYFKVWGFETFDAYVENELGWQERKGWYFVAIQKKLVVGANMTKERLEEIGWSKASQLARLPDDEIKTTENRLRWGSPFVWMYRKNRSGRVATVTPKSPRR